MTDKQIIIDGVDVSRCRHYDDRYGYCDACRDDIDGASFTKCLYEDNCYYKQLKRAEAQCEAMFVSHTDLEKKYKAKEQECKNNKIAYQMELDIFNQECLNLLEELKAKEQECEELKKKQRCAWKSLEGTFCPEAQEQLEAYKMEAEEGKEINAELKAELEQEKALKETYLACYKAKHEDIEGKLFKLKQILTEIKEIAEICKCHNADGCYECKYFYDCEVEDEEIPTRDVCKLILQKISECEGNDEIYGK